MFYLILLDNGYFRFPTDQTPWRSNSFCYGVYINENTPNKDLVEDLLKAFASDRAFQTAFDEKKSIVGSRPDVFDLSKLDPLRQELIPDVNNPDGSYMPSNEMCWPPRLTDELFEVLDQVIMNLMTPEEGAAQLDELAAEIGFYRF